MLYNLTLSHMRVFCVKSVDATQILLILGAGYFTLNEGRLRFKLVTFCHVNEPT